MPVMYMRMYSCARPDQEVRQDIQVPPEHPGSGDEVPGEACGAVPGRGGEYGPAEAGGRDQRPQDVWC